MTATRVKRISHTFSLTWAHRARGRVGRGANAVPFLKFTTACSPVVLATIFATFNAHAAAVAEYPTKPIRLIVPFAAGGGLDVLGRMIAQRLTDRFGQPVVVDNRTGAGGTVGAEITAKSAPDGYTLIMGSIGTHAISPGLYKNLPYDAVRDFTPVTQITMSPNILLVNSSLPVTTVKELIALAKAKPDQLNYGSGGVGGTTHLSAELLKSLAQIRLNHVPYKGGSQAVIALLGGEVSIIFNTIISSMPHVKAGKLKALGVTSTKRSPAAPTLVTIAEAGVPGYEFVSWYGVLGPAGMPAHAVSKLNDEIRRIMSAEAIVTSLASDALEVVTGTPQEFANHIRQEVAKWGKVIKNVGIRAE